DVAALGDDELALLCALRGGPCRRQCGGRAGDAGGLQQLATSETAHETPPGRVLLFAGTRVRLSSAADRQRGERLTVARRSIAGASAPRRARSRDSRGRERRSRWRTRRTARGRGSTSSYARQPGPGSDRYTRARRVRATDGLYGTA